MALPALVNGADCGPLNPLQSLSKQFEKDRGVPQDHFGPGRAGPSRENFRTKSAVVPGLDQEATQFFSGSSSNVAFSPQHIVPNSFDLSTLWGTLPQQQQAQIPPQIHSSPWAGDFLKQSDVQGMAHGVHQMSNMNTVPTTRADPMETQFQPYVSLNANTFMNSILQTPSNVGLIIPENVFPGFVQSRSDNITQADFPPEETQKQERQGEPYAEAVDADELSRTAGLLVEAVKGETNPEFKNSAFLGLMRQLRDREMVVEGTNMVKARSSSTNEPPSSWTQEFTSMADAKGKGKAKAESGWADAFQETAGSQMTESWVSQNQHLQSQQMFVQPGLQADVPVRRKSVHFGQPEVLEDNSTTRDQMEDESETAEDAFWKQENAEYQNYWRGASAHPGPPVIHPEWGRLQEDWDRFEATATGIKPVSVYQFQSNNPYLLGDSSTRNHMLHTQRMHTNESILEKEATIQKDIHNPVAWFELGVKQQENEREQFAIQALKRAVELNPSYLEAWLALAISYTNEGDKSGAYDAIEHWVQNNVRYDAHLMVARDVGEEKVNSERHEQLIQCLMTLARVAPDGEVDADIQTALGVILNTSEDYQKAHDCFRAALAVRPNDWLLYNRVGATLANSGRAADALWYYYRALELNPSYIRARFNLGISCINMKNYYEAAQHILDALVLQENDASNMTDTRGITSSALWECLRTTCMQLQRPELAVLCDAHDLGSFRKAFPME